MRILIVDDDVNNIELIKSYLAPLGLIDFVSSHSGADGVEMARSQAPDLILMDLLLRAPMPFGWDAIQILKDDPKTRHIPIVAITAGGPSAIQKALQAGCDAYVERPFRINDLLSTVQKLLSMAG
ncbi:MAG: response regulator [Anaerolineae bacterium]|nr:response regulator [Anaerolineae bacterium]MDW8173636.1 response regulator [Anaerolineae bacterium]